MMDEQTISYALSKQVPDMQGRGFIIGTSYGPIDIPPGRVADAIARAVTRALQCELLAATKRAEHAKRHEIAKNPDAQGRDYFDRLAIAAGANLTGA